MVSRQLPPNRRPNWSGGLQLGRTLRHPLDAVARDVIDRRIVFPIREEQSAREGQTLPVEDWYAENRRQTEGAGDHEPIDADRWLYVHLDEVLGATSDAPVEIEYVLCERSSQVA